MTRLRPRVFALIGSAMIVAVVGPLALSGRLAKPDRPEKRAAIAPATGRSAVPHVTGKGSIAPELPAGTRIHSVDSDRFSRAMRTPIGVRPSR